MRPLLRWSVCRGSEKVVVPLSSNLPYIVIYKIVRPNFFSSIGFKHNTYIIPHNILWSPPPSSTHSVPPRSASSPRAEVDGSSALQILRKKAQTQPLFIGEEENDALISVYDDRC